MNSLEKIKKYFLDLPEVIRIKELEHYIDNNNEIKNRFEKIKEIQKQMVNSQEYNQINQYKQLEEAYEIEKQKLLDIPFVEEYLELLQTVNDMLNYLTEEISDKINKKING